LLKFVEKELLKKRFILISVLQLGLKFERCFNQEPVAFKLLSEDYSKMIFLHCDRYVEVTWELTVVVILSISYEIGVKIFEQLKRLRYESA
jgi:hypothetical protein